MKNLLLLVFLISFSLSVYAEVNVEDLRPWAPMEFTYKTGGSSTACMSGYSDSEDELYMLNLRLKEEPDNEELYIEIMDELYKYVDISPVAMSFYVSNLPGRYESVVDDLKEMLPFTENYPSFASFIFLHFITMSVDDPELKYIRSIPNYKDYICELKHRGCMDMTMFVEVNCDDERSQ